MVETEALEVHKEPVAEVELLLLDKLEVEVKKVVTAVAEAKVQLMHHQ